MARPTVLKWDEMGVDPFIFGYVGRHGNTFNFKNYFFAKHFTQERLFESFPLFITKIYIEMHGHYNLHTLYLLQTAEKFSEPITKAGSYNSRLKYCIKFCT